MDLKEYIGKQTANLDQKESFNSILKSSEESGEVYGYPCIENSLLLDDFFDVVGLEVPEDLRSDFKIFYVPDVDCPCILYNGETDLDEFRIVSGIRYTTVLFKTSRGFFADASTDELLRKYIFITGGTNSKEKVDRTTFHEIIHFFNSFRFKYPSNSNLNNIYRFLLDESNAYSLANGIFPDISKFYYLRNHTGETLINPTLETPRDIDIFANVYFSFYKAYRKGMEHFHLLIDSLLDTPPDAAFAQVCLKGSPYQFLGESDLKMMYSFIRNSFKDESYSGEILSNNKLILAEQLHLWALKQFTQNESILESKSNQVSFQNIIKNLDNLHRIELKVIGSNMYSNIRARQRNIIERELLPSIPENLEEEVHRIFQIQLNDSWFNEYHPDNVKEIEDLIDFSIQLANDSTASLSLRKKALKFLNNELAGNGETILGENARSVMRFVKMEMEGEI